MAWLTAAALAVSAVGTAASISSSQKAAKATNNQIRSQQEIADNENMRTRINSIRATRIAAAQTAQMSTNQGVGGSSSAAGALAAVTGQGNADRSFLDRQLALGRQSFGYATQANKFNARAQMWSSVASTSLQLAGSSFAAKADATFDKIFAKKSFINSNVSGLTGNSDMTVYGGG
jgi:hypothetical protein